MDQLLVFLLLVTLIHSQLPLILMAQSPLPISHITVQGSVFCDVCYDNTFSRHSYFLPGANVQIQCKFKANSPGTTEQMAFSVNRTTNRYGVYKLDIPSIEGVDCAEDPEIQFFCEVALLRTASPAACSVPGLRSTNFPPYDGGIHWPQFPPLPSLPPLPQFPPLPTLPPLPQFPPLPSLPLPHFPSFPFYPLPPLPPLPSLPPFPFPPVTIPAPPPPLSFVFPSNPPPNYPFVSPPRPPGFNLADPRTWIPNYPPAPPPPQQLQP